MDGKWVKIEVFVPPESLPAIRQAVNEAATDRDSRYDMVCAFHPVTGSWRPLEGSKPFLGKTGQLCEAEEVKLEFRCARKLASVVVSTVRAHHPYEEPVINVLALLDV